MSHDPSTRRKKKGDTVADVTDLATSQAEVQRRVAAIAPGQWDLPTPCADWSVRDVVVHLIGGSQMTVLLLGGASADESRAAFAAKRGPDLGSELDAALAVELAAFGDPDAFKRIVHHPAAGDVPGATLFGFRTGDYLLHSWDLARATNGDEQLHEGLVSTTWDAMQPMAPFIGQTGVFGSGPSGDVAADAPLQQRLLDFTGRRP
jgi:uncharacterized protein (TIGR03086 family)